MGPNRREKKVLNCGGKDQTARPRRVKLKKELKEEKRIRAFAKKKRALPCAQEEKRNL